jgi:hypothetical protein
MASLSQIQKWGMRVAFDMKNWSSKSMVKWSQGDNVFLLRLIGFLIPYIVLLAICGCGGPALIISTAFVFSSGQHRSRTARVEKD